MTARETDRHPDPTTDPGAYIGHEPEAASETILGGHDPADVRMSAVATQRAPEPDESDPGEADQGAAASGRRGQGDAELDEATSDAADVIRLPGPAGDPERGE